MISRINVSIVITWKQSSQRRLTCYMRNRVEVSSLMVKQNKLLFCLASVILLKSDLFNFASDFHMWKKYNLRRIKWLIFKPILSRGWYYSFGSKIYVNNSKRLSEVALKIWHTLFVTHHESDRLKLSPNVVLENKGSVRSTFVIAEIIKGVS